jgi:beta-lactamase regulating signal transducer with metallopeptidase domain
MNIKELNDSELLDKAYKHLEIADKHLYSTIILSVVSIIQAILLIFNIVGVVSFLVIYLICFLLYLYHRKKQEKYMKIVDELLKEFTSRGV